MTLLQSLVSEGVEAPDHRPYPRVEVTAETWQRAGDALAEGACVLLALWATPGSVHMALFESDAVAVLSLDCPDGRFPSIG